MKHAPTSPHIVLPAFAAAMLLSSTSAFAAGVPAGTLIENTATASYNTGGPTLTIDSNTVTVRVDELLDVAVASQDAGAVAITGSAVLTFSVTNTGNGPEAFVLTADPAIAGNDFDVTITSLAVDTNGNGVYDVGIDALIANGGTSPSIAADGSLTVFVLVTAPAGAVDGTNSQVSLLAEAATGTGSPGTTFAGEGVGGGDAVVGASGADDEDTGSLIAAIASLALVKSAVTVDPFGGDQPVPGATITYSLVATVTGTGSISDLTISDSIPDDTTYDPGSLTLQGASLTDADDADAGEASAAGVAVEIGTLAAGASRTVTFDVVIDAN